MLTTTLTWLIVALFVSVDGFSGLSPRRWVGRGLRAVSSSGSRGLEGANLLHVLVPSTDVPSAVQFYKRTCGMEVQRTDEAGNTFIGFGSEGDGEHVALKLNPSASAVRPATADGSSQAVVVDDEVLLGISVVVPDLAAAVASAEASGAQVLKPFANNSLPASIYPDEEPIHDERLRPWVLRAVVQDPYSGFAVELTQGEGSTPRLARVTLRVPDLEDATEFFTKDLGMTLHRKRSLMPAEAAIAAYVGFQPTEEEGTVLELRYVYGRAYGRFKSKKPKQTAMVAFSVPDVAAATAQLTSAAGDSAEQGSDEVLEVDLAGWGEALFEAQATLDEARAVGDATKVKSAKFRIAQLEYKKPTRAAAEQAEGKSAEKIWWRPKCEVVSGKGPISGWGDEVTILKAAQPSEGLGLVLIDELEFLQQTLA